MGQYDKAICYYRVSLEPLTVNGDNEDIIYTNIAKRFETKGDLSQELKNYLLAIKVQVIEYASWHTESGKTYCAIGDIYEKERNTTLSIKYLDKAFCYLILLEKQQLVSKLFDSDLAETCDYLDLIHEKRDNHQEAMASFEKASNKLRPWYIVCQQLASSDIQKIMCPFLGMIPPPLFRYLRFPIMELLLTDN
ncbi:unnamed protein product [Rotaria magnacalcarata]|uniref:Uncharacterized protein n=1 Tax=Rotaria magnacalcarata TaxID=392030 RepID=A0A816XCZ7_9BILA|nr:unnamed protein product [Rotaria magnacalcarata]CAF2144866.1 unnamed protein product [Rotaria magnacalcarata]CAF4294085.1 unnamed protein product [Rotaria magnacalcarata]CAF4422802.1 unnamed protein product [Rotaria magnacalcarata]